MDVPIAQVLRHRGRIGLYRTRSLNLFNPETAHFDLAFAVHCKGLTLVWETKYAADQIKKQRQGTVFGVTRDGLSVSALVASHTAQLAARLAGRETAARARSVETSMPQTDRASEQTRRMQTFGALTS
jgi:hypothetical protein